MTATKERRTVQLGIVMDEELRDMLRQLADHRYTNMSQVIRDMVREKAAEELQPHPVTPSFNTVTRAC